MLWHVFEWGDQCYGMFSNGGTNAMACFRMAEPGGTNVMACFRMAGGRTNVMACFRMAGGWALVLGPRVWALGFRGLGGTNVMACFEWRVAGPMLWPVFERLGL